MGRENDSGEWAVERETKQLDLATRAKCWLLAPHTHGEMRLVRRCSLSRILIFGALLRKSLKLSLAIISRACILCQGLF